MPTPAGASARAILLDLYDAALQAVAAEPAVLAALPQHDPGRSPWILALGKAAGPMAVAAVRWLTERGDAPAGGIIVAPEPVATPHPALQSVVGDHPQPADGSFAAATALGDVVSRMPHDAPVLVLLSGGTSSLIGAPDAGISRTDLNDLFRLLLGSGLDIAAMNAVRKRFTRWGGGKLARALTGRRVIVLIISDVIGDDLAAIASGPCVPDPNTSADVRALLERSGLHDTIPATLRRHLEHGGGGQSADAQRAAEATFATVSNVIIASNRLALDAASRRAAELGLAPIVHPTLLAGEASEVGASVATALKKYARDGGTQPRVPAALIWGGETTVTLGATEPGAGGRSQELALAAARTLAGSGTELALLAAGTDGRDGPTDAAGAIVDGSTWAAITAAGRDPADHLRRHDAYHALEAGQALVQVGMTGTNVMDVVIGLVT
jgi:hydroxypyruvate reductase